MFVGGKNSEERKVVDRHRVMSFFIPTDDPTEMSPEEFTRRTGIPVVWRFDPDRKGLFVYRMYMNVAFHACLYYAQDKHPFELRIPGKGFIQWSSVSSTGAALRGLYQMMRQVTLGEVLIGLQDIHPRLSRTDSVNMYREINPWCVVAPFLVCMDQLSVKGTCPIPPHLAEEIAAFL